MVQALRWGREGEGGAQWLHKPNPGTRGVRGSGSCVLEYENDDDTIIGTTATVNNLLTFTERASTSTRSRSSGSHKGMRLVRQKLIISPA